MTLRSSATPKALKVHEFLKEHQWTQFRHPYDEVDPSRGFCLLMAIATVTGKEGTPKRLELFYKLDNYLATTYGPDYSSIAEWNDDPRRTREEVISVLEHLDI